MRIGVLKDSAPRERRVALTPDAVAKLIKDGFEIVVEAGAGDRAYFDDATYQAVGARIGSTAEAGDADLVCRVQLPTPGEVTALREGTVLIALAGALEQATRDALASRRLSLLALEKVPRITRAQSMDVLSSQATVAGYKAALLGAGAVARFLPMLTTAAGSLPPAKALILGAGVAGLQAIATTRRLGAVVTGFDVRPAAAEDVRSLGAKFLAPEAITAEAETAGGYARELGDEQQRRVLAAIDGAIGGSDLVIATAAIPGKPAPRLITAGMVAKMKPGSVIVDVSAETGGNCELTRPGETIEHDQVTILGPLNLPSTMPVHASQMFARNVQTLIQHLVPEGALALDLTDEITGAMCLLFEGHAPPPAVSPVSTGSPQ
jgi:proton-translocating NAD(P)+ transhydrogenase subunit alpha